MEREFHAALVTGLCPLEVMKRAGRLERPRQCNSWPDFGDDDEGTELRCSLPEN